MADLSYERHCAEIIVQTALLRSVIEGAGPVGASGPADLTAPVPTCPEWNLGQLLRHLGCAHRRAEETVRTRAAEPLPIDRVRYPSWSGEEDPAVLGPWLTEGAGQLVETLLAAGRDTKVSTTVPGQPLGFWPRRMADETVIHRADVALAVGAEFSVEQDVAVDAFDELLWLGSQPVMYGLHPELHELLGPGRTLHFHATDAGPELGAEWLVDLTGDAITWRRTHEKAAVAVRGPLTELLLVAYRRLPPRTGGIEIFGDAELLDFWLERVVFG